jgi:hypothetical protein
MSGKECSGVLLFIYLFQNLQTKTCPKKFYLFTLKKDIEEKIVNFTEKKQTVVENEYF